MADSPLLPPHSSSSVPNPGLGGGGDVRPPGYEELTPLVMQLSEQDKVKKSSFLALSYVLSSPYSSNHPFLPHTHTQRETALMELSKKREIFPDLAPILWHSVGTMSALLQEIVAIYPMLSPPTLTAQASNRVCNALALLQCVASHTETRALFLQAHIPMYLYPFLNTVSK